MNNKIENRLREIERYKEFSAKDENIDWLISTVRQKEVRIKELEAKLAFANRTLQICLDDYTNNGMVETLRKALALLENTSGNDCKNKFHYMSGIGVCPDCGASHEIDSKL